MPDFTYRPLAFTGPVSGDRVEFIYDGAIDDGVTHNLGEFQFAGVDDKYFQDRSISSDAYGFTLLFDDQDDLRTARRILSEKNRPGQTGTLEHPDPTIGSFPVVTASFSVSQNSVKGRGRAALQVVWYKTIPDLVGGDPSAAGNPASAAAIRAAIDELNIDQAGKFADSVEQEPGSAFARIVESTISAVESAQELFSDIASRVDSVNIAFTSTAFQIISTADELARTPFDLARQVQNLIQLPMLAINSAQERLDAYQDYVSQVLGFSNDEELEFESGTPAGKNVLSVAAVASLAAISAMNYSAVSTDSLTIDEIRSGSGLTDDGYLSRTGIISSINSLIDTAKGTTETLSDKAANFGAVSFFDQYFDYSILNKNLIAASVKNLNSRIFNSTREVIITNDVERSPIELCALLYNSIEVNTIQFFIESNQLHGDEIFLVPKGRDIVYYE